jgi:hypothetical protein
MKSHLRTTLILSSALLGSAFCAFAADDKPASVAFDPSKPYEGKPFEDSKYTGGAQKLPGKLQCAYFDLGGEGVAYHDLDKKNNGSGALNPIDPNKPNYLHEFRAKESVDTSYAKGGGMDDSEFSIVKPPKEQLYVGWTSAEEWLNYTVEVEKAGTYTVDLLYTSNKGGTIMLDLNGKPMSATPINVISTNDPKDPTGYRQWHHWNLMKDIVSVDLPKGKNVITFRILTEGNMNLGYLDFREKGAAEPAKATTEPVKAPEAK